MQFNIDTIPDEEVSTAIKSKKRSANEVDPASSDAAWHDEDDDELLINLDTTNRLKKLKTASHKSSVVSGQQLSELLQKRYFPTLFPLFTYCYGYVYGFAGLSQRKQYGVFQLLLTENMTLMTYLMKKVLHKFS